jgi:hypothetical protein
MLQLYYTDGARDSVEAKALYYKPVSRGFETRWSEYIFSIYLIISTALDPEVY